MLVERNKRIRPATDDKILTAWNGLLIRGLAHAGISQAQPAWIALAQSATDFIKAHSWNGTHLYATWQQGSGRYLGYLDDYANMLDGLVTLLSAQWRSQDLQFAITLADALLEEFYDVESGGFFFTRHNHEELIYRPKPTMDDAIPPGNATAARGLLTLGHLLGETKYLDAAHNTLRWARAVMERLPAGHCSLLSVVEESVYPNDLVILRGPKALTDTWRQQLQNGYTPWRKVFAIPYDASNPLPGYLPKLVSHDAQQAVTGFVCSGLQCSLPMTELADVQKALN
jgi:hypothetical protein